MSLDSLWLSLFAFTILMVEIWLYRFFDLSFMRHGKNIRLSRIAVMVICGSVALTGICVGTVFIYFSGPLLLQIFYIAMYGVSAALTLLFLLRISRLGMRITVAIIGAAAMCGIIVALPYQMAQNIFIVFALLWVGPVVSQRFSIKPWIAGVGLIAAMLIDAYNVFAPSTGSALFSDEELLLNGSISFGNASFGMGDFFLLFLIIGFTRKWFGPRWSIVLALLVTIPRLTLRVIFPQLAGVVMPYYLLIVPVTLFLWWVLLRARRGAPQIRSIQK